MKWDDWLVCFVSAIGAAYLGWIGIRALKSGKVSSRGKWVSREDDPEHFRFLVRADFITAAMLAAFAVYVAVGALFPSLNLPPMSVLNP